jgi:hypothetical protein
VTDAVVAGRSEASERVLGRLEREFERLAWLQRRNTRLRGGEMGGKKGETYEVGESASAIERSYCSE